MGVGKQFSNDVVRKGMGLLENIITETEEVRVSNFSFIRGELIYWGLKPGVNHCNRRLIL